MVDDSSASNNEDKNDDRDSIATQYRYYYSVLNVPRDANIAHIQRNYKLLSRIYHPDKATSTGISTNGNNSLDVAQQSFVIIKTAVDVLCDPIYRFAYDYGDDVAVTLVKRSQSARHTEQQRQHNNDENNDKNAYNDNRNTERRRKNEKSEDNDDDLYTMVQNKLRQNQEEEAISILQEVLENYYLQQQNLANNMYAAKCDLSCSIPMTWKESDKYYYSTRSNYRKYQLQKESISLNAQSRYPVNSQFGITLNAGSEVNQKQQQPDTNNNKGNNHNKSSIKGSIGWDYQPIRGTSINGNITINPNRIRSPDISMSTSRKFSNESVVVAAIHGNVQNSKSWYTSFISSKPILYETIFGNSFGTTTNTNDKKKLMMNWRIICDMVGRLRGFMMSIRNIEYPMWSCRLSMSNYPIKLSWCGAETDTFYIAVALGIVDWPRIKTARISNIGSGDRNDHPQWKIKYGLKHDPGQLYANGGLSLWSITCTVQFSNEFTLRLPIRLLQSSTTPVAWVGSILIAEFVDQQLKYIQWNDGTRCCDDNFPSHIHNRSSNHQPNLPTVALDMYQKVAQKKRVEESKKPDGLVILQASLSCSKNTEIYDITDTLQFWVVNSQLNMSLSDERLMWQVGDRRHKKDAIVTETSLRWWHILFHTSKPSPSENETEDISSLDVRYQYNRMTYQILFNAAAYNETDDENKARNRSTGLPIAIQLPNMNAMELGPSNSVR